MPVPAPTVPKIACFHGGGSNAAILKVQCARIQAMLRDQFEFVYYDAPFVSEVSGLRGFIIFRRERNCEIELKNEKNLHTYRLVKRASTMEQVIVIGEKEGSKITGSHFRQIGLLLRNDSYQSALIC